ncbi:ABC transporter permease [Burkholderia sp. BCC0397]|uniref:ABC transporter permease n=1 Tax=Burkholderia sp. BCC0397 TaxID=486876 RepID=UPI00158D9F5F|nr:ABC transporter permease [Burkholderia sp. BCC0397]
MRIDNLSQHATASSLVLMSPSQSAVSRLWRFLCKRHWTFRVGVVMLVVLVVTLIVAPWIVPYDPAAQNLLARLAPPSAVHWLGTDQLGRDTFSRLLVGGRFTVTIALITVMLSVAIGTVIGVVAGRIQGSLLDEIAMRVVDVLISVPDVVVAIFLVAIMGPGYLTVIASLTVVGWTPFARLARALTMTINAQGFIHAAEVLGCSRSFIILRHIIPNIIRSIAAVSFLRFGHKLITVGALSFLGLGVQPPAADWALMMADSQPYVERLPILMIAPGLAIFLAALSVTWIGHGFQIKAKGEGSSDE